MWYSCSSLFVVGDQVPSVSWTDVGPAGQTHCHRHVNTNVREHINEGTRGANGDFGYAAFLLRLLMSGA